MPILNLKTTKALDANSLKALIQQLTKVTETILKKRSEVTAVCVEFIDPSQWFIHHEPITHLSKETFYLDIKVTESTNTKDEKNAYISSVFELMQAHLGAISPVSYVYIEEVKADSYGYGGKSQEFRYIEAMIVS